MRGVLPLLLVASGLLAGCAAPAPEETPPPGTVLPVLGLDGQGCRETFLAIPVEEGRLRAALPPELEPAPAPAPFDQLQSAGRTFVTASITDCADGNVSGERVLYHFGAVSTLVHPLEASGTDEGLYQFEAYTGDGRAAEALAEGGWPVAVANVAWTRNRGPAGPQVLHAIWQNGSATYEFDGVLDTNAPQQPPAPAYALSMYRTIDGALAEMRWNVPESTVTGTGNGILRMTQGSFLAALVGGTEAEVFLITTAWPGWDGTRVS